MDYSATAEDPLSLAENLCHNLHPVELYQSGVFQKLSGECRVPSLFVIQGRNKGTRYDLAAFEGATSIGRDSVNSIQLQDNEVSRSHAEIRLVGETVVLSDLKSSNGTYLNNRKVERAELASGDQIQIGRTVLVFSKDLENERAIGLVDIVSPSSSNDHSRIVRTISEDEAAIPAYSPDDTQNRSLARARSNRHVSNGTGRQPYARHR